MQTESIQILLEAIEGNTAALKEIQTKLSGIKTTTTEITEKQASLGKQFKQSWTEINQAIGVARQAYQLLRGAVNETVGAFVTYAGQVREISQVTGQHAEEVSRLIQVTDDYKIKTESLNTVMRKMATEGMPLTIDALAQLSDKYLKLGSGVERQIFLTDTFGRQGVDFAEIMLAGGDAIRKQSDAISDNLILTEAALKKARDYEIAQDNLHDSVQGLKIALGEEFTPAIIAGTNAITDVITETQLYSRANELGITVSKEFRDSLHGVYNEELVQAELLRLVTQAEQDNTNALVGMTTATNMAVTSTDMFTGAILDSATALQQEQAEFGFIINFAKQYENNLANITTAEGNLRAAEDDLATARAQWPEGNQHVIDAQIAVDGLKVKLGEAQQASLDATNEMIAGFLQAQLTADGSFTEADIQKVLNYRQAVGLLTMEAYNAALEALHIAENLASIPDKTIHVTTIYSSSGQFVNVPEVHGGHASGGSFSGWAMVGDRPGGGITPYTEWVYAPHGAMVYNQSQMTGQSAPPMASGGAILPMDMSILTDEIKALRGDMRRLTGEIKISLKEAVQMVVA